MRTFFELVLVAAVIYLLWDRTQSQSGAAATSSGQMPWIENPASPSGQIAEWGATLPSVPQASSAGRSSCCGGLG